MKYKIKDLQFDCKYFSDGAIFNSKEDILEQLASYHDIDYEGVKDDGKDTPYEDIWEFLNTLKNDKTKLEWILGYGQWEIEGVENFYQVKGTINNFILYLTSDKKERKELQETLSIYLKDGIPF